MSSRDLMVPSSSDPPAPEFSSTWDEYDSERRGIVAKSDFWASVDEVRVIKSKLLTNLYSA